MNLVQKLSLEMHRGIVSSLIQTHQLKQLFWESTLRCNLHCRHCGSDCKVSSASQDMPFKDFAKVLDNVSAHTDPNKVMVIVSGGEPLMRSDLEYCGLEIYKKGFPWGMVTNGYALTEERFRKLRASGLHSISISLDGLKDNHDWMRCVPGSFERAINAIRIVVKSGITSDVITCVNARNIDSLDEIKDLLIKLGVRRWRIFTVFPQGRAKDDSDMQLSGSQIRQVMEYIKKVRKEGKISCNFSCEGFLGEYEGVVRDTLYTCIAGVSVASVLIDGSISACTSIRSNYHQGNIYHDDFWTIWSERFEKYRDRSWMKSGMCADCKYFRYCMGNGMHLRDDSGQLIQCLLKKMQ